jgi:hypothetical protein
MLISGWFPSTAKLKKKACQTSLPELDYERVTWEAGHEAAEAFSGLKSR